MTDLLPLQDVYANLLASAVWTAGARVQATLKSRNPSPAAPDVHDAGLEALLDLAEVEKFAERLGGERLREFLLSPEARDIAIGVSLAVLARSREERDERPSPDGSIYELLRWRFIATLAWYLERSQASIQADADRLYDILLEAVRHSTRIPANRMDDFGHTGTIQQLQHSASLTAGRTVSLFSRGEAPDFAETFRFESKVRSAARSRYRRMEPPRHSAERTIALNELYIEPAFRDSRQSRPGDVVFGSGAFTSGIQKAVVLGNPGAGKSSFARALCHVLAGAEGLDAATPFLVELRDYASFKERRADSIKAYLEQLARSDYQADPPENALEYILMSGRAFIVFDGLDELLDTRDRGAVRSDIEVFAEQYPFTRIVVTSREVGYLDAPLSQDFTTAYIAEFDREQIEEYAIKWFAINDADSDDGGATRARAFLYESSVVPDLRTNPLLLALMCSIYKRDRFIPRNRADVYEQCAEMLFDGWDRSKRIRVDRPLEPHLTPLLAEVAHWMLITAADRTGATHKQLVSRASEYIQREAIDDRVVANATAESIVKFCHGRGWVLVGVGTNHDDDELYGFAHRTFLEFYAAKWFATRGVDSEKLAQDLLPSILQGGADIIALLAVQIRTDTVQGAGSEILDELLTFAATAATADRTRVLNFSARTLEFMVPRPSVTRALARAVIRDHVARALMVVLEAPPNEPSEVDTDPVEYLFRGRPEVNAIVAVEAADTLVEGTRDECDLNQVAVSTDLAFASGDFVARGDSAESVSRFWKASGDRLVARGKNEAMLARTLLAHSRVTSRWVLQWHGIGALIGEHRCASMPDTYIVAPGDVLLAETLGTPSFDALGRTLRARLREVHRWMTSARFPWVQRETPVGAVRSWASPGGKEFAEVSSLNAEQEWTVTMLALVTLQLMPPKSRSQSIEWLRRQHTQLHSSIAGLASSQVARPPEVGATRHEMDLLCAVWSGDERLVAQDRPHPRIIAGLW